MEIVCRRNAVIAILLLVGQISARPQSNELEEIKKALYKACSGKYPITEEMKENAKMSILSEDRNFKCFLMCTLDEFSLIDDEGVIDGETMKSIVLDSMKEGITKIVSSCLPSDAGKPDTCEIAFNFASCGIKSSPEMIDAEGVIDGNAWINISLDIGRDALTKAVTACLLSDAGKPDACEATFSFLGCAMIASPELVEMIAILQNFGLPV